MSAVIEAAMRAMVEGYTNPTGAQATMGPSAYGHAVAVVLAFILTLVLLALVGMWLWNYSVVPLFEFARPAKSVFQIIGLAIFLAIILP
jgi:hypothetical protein